MRRQQQAMQREQQGRAKGPWQRVRAPGVQATRMQTWQQRQAQRWMRLAMPPHQQWRHEGRRRASSGWLRQAQQQQLEMQAQSVAWSLLRRAMLAPWLVTRAMLVPWLVIPPMQQARRTRLQQGGRGCQL